MDKLDGLTNAVNRMIDAQRSNGAVASPEHVKVLDRLKTMHTETHRKIKELEVSPPVIQSQSHALSSQPHVHV